MSDVMRRVRNANPVPDSSHLLLDREEFTDLVVERRDKMVLGRSAATGALHPGSRWQIALVAFALVLVTGGGVWLAGSMASGDLVGADAASASEAQLALASAAHFFDALNSGDLETAQAIMAPAISRDPKIARALQFFSGLPGTKSLSSCSTTARVLWTDVACDITLSGPLFVATGQDTARGVLRVDDEGLITSSPVIGRRLEADRAFVEYAKAIEPVAFQRSCDPEAYVPGSVEISKLAESLAWTGECAQLWAELSDDAAAWVYAGKPTLDRGETIEPDPGSS